MNKAGLQLFLSDVIHTERYEFFDEVLHIYGIPFDSDTYDCFLERCKDTHDREDWFLIAVDCIITWLNYRLCRVIRITK